MKVAALDIETTGLDWQKDSITVVGIHDGIQGQVYRDLEELSQDLKKNRSRGVKYVGQNFKFDLKFLMYNGVDITLDDWVGDTRHLALSNPHKIPNEWMEQYEEKRKELNKLFSRTANRHREASPHSLKTLAPYYLKVAPFWEDPNQHDNNEYVLKDCKYTLDLYHHFMQTLPNDVVEFAQQRLLKWDKLLTRMEMRGIQLDLDLMQQMKQQAALDSEEALKNLNNAWQIHTDAWRTKEHAKLVKRYDEMTEKAIKKLKDKSKAPATKVRYMKNFDAAVEKIKPFNYDSSAQLKWLLKERLRLDVKRLDNEEESTGKSVLENLAQQGNNGVKHLLDYRKARKLATAFFPSYEEMHKNGVIHTNFNIGGTRTGRLSSSKPNLQQVPGNIHKLFVARPGHKLLTYDQSAIEARLIAYVTEDPILTSICLDNHSIHDYNTKYIFFPEECKDIPITEIKKRVPHLRAISKTVGFALFYGAGAKRIHYATKQAGMSWTLEDAQAALDRFKEEYSQVFVWKAQFDAMLASRPYTHNLFGRPFTIEPKHIYMTGFNTFIQGSASDLMLYCAEKLQQRCDNTSFPLSVLLLVHDEAVIEVREDKVGEACRLVEDEFTPELLEEIRLVVEGSANDFWDKG